MTKFLLDSGDPNEYREAKELFNKNNSELWGSTTNPSLIAKKLAGQKLSFEDAFYTMQKEIVMEILDIVPGIVSAEVYSDLETKAEDMIKQGLEISKWHKRIAVKLPTTLEGFKARGELRKQKILINNTLVFSQKQSFAILLHEKIMLENYGLPDNETPCFISPFVGRLDDIGIDGMSFVENALKTQRQFFKNDTCWMLEASIRNVEHIKRGLDIKTDLMTSPLKVYKEYFNETTNDLTVNKDLSLVPYWLPNKELLDITSEEEFFSVIENNKLNINHELTTAGIEKFVSDWGGILN